MMIPPSDQAVIYDRVSRGFNLSGSFGEVLISMIIPGLS